MASQPKGATPKGSTGRQSNKARTSIVEEAGQGCSRQDAQVLLLKLCCYQRSQRVVLYTPEEVEKDILTIQQWSVI